MIIKWLVLALIVAGVWFGFKAISRRNDAKKVDGASKDAVEDMTACSTCGDYVPASQRDCGKAGCPYPR